MRVEKEPTNEMVRPPQLPSWLIEEGDGIPEKEKVEKARSMVRSSKPASLYIYLFIIRGFTSSLDLI